MGADSSPRRLLKRLLYPLLNETAYRVGQAAAKAWDIRTGGWYEPEIDLIRHAVRPGDVALDIGANYGLYAYHLSRAVGPRGRVYAFEPVPFTFRTCRLVARILRLRNTELIDKGCGDRSERMVFRVPVQASRALSAGQAYLGTRNDARQGSETQVRWEETREVWCDVVALDEFLPDVADLSFVKADIEGAELFAFSGAVKTIERHFPTVVCEINPWFLEGFGLRLDELTGFFLERDYELYRYDAAGGRGRLHPCHEAEIVEDNYVFVHPERRGRVAALCALSDG